MIKKFLKHLYYKEPKTYPIVKFIVNIYYSLETKLISDETYYKKSFRRIFGYELDLKNPQTFNEKINWLKLNQRSNLITLCADKFAVRAFVQDNLNSDENLIPLVFHTNDYKKITKESLPDFPVIIKANHYSSEVCIIRNKENVNFKKVQFDCKRWLNHNFYFREREWQYKNINRKLIVEKLITDKNGNLPLDYKFHCFHGKVELIQLDVDRDENHKRNLYDENFNFLEIGLKVPRGENIYKKPENFEKMKRIAERLAEKKGGAFIYVRVDLYNVDGVIYFGELTFTPGAGLEKFTDPEWDQKLGQKIHL